eukprot:1353654-Amorphochlora_amoeboformis.AAC.1
MRPNVFCKAEGGTKTFAKIAMYSRQNVLRAADVRGKTIGKNLTRGWVLVGSVAAQPVTPLEHNDLSRSKV